MQYILTEQEYKELVNKVNVLKDIGNHISINNSSSEVKDPRTHETILKLYGKSTLNIDLLKILTLLNAEILGCDLKELSEIKISKGEIIINL